MIMALLFDTPDRGQAKEAAISAKCFETFAIISFRSLFFHKAIAINLSKDVPVFSSVRTYDGKIS